MSIPRIGTELAGYRIESLIARGGMSVVYLAENPKMGNEVALKILAPEYTDHEELRERFVRESRTAARINHPNILPIYDAGSADGALFIAMRYVDGPDLKRVIQDQSPLSFDRVFLIMGQIASALDAAHQAGLVHRDVKPGNVLVAPKQGPGETDFVYLTDFGVTKRLKGISGPTMTGDFLGTVDYVAPEQVEGKPIDGRADIYSLGCMLFECLTGSVPFDLPTDTSVIWAHMNDEARPPSAVRRDVPPAVDAVVGKAMAKDRDQRYDTCAELMIDLRQALAGSLGTYSGPRVGISEGGFSSDREVPLTADSAPVTGAPPTVVQQPQEETGATLAGASGQGTSALQDHQASSSGVTPPDGSDPIATVSAPPDDRRTSRVRSNGWLVLLAALIGGALASGAFLIFDGSSTPGDTSAPTHTGSNPAHPNCSSIGINDPLSCHVFDRVPDAIQETGHCVDSLDDASMAADPDFTEPSGALGSIICRPEGADVDLAHYIWFDGIAPMQTYWSQQVMAIDQLGQLANDCQTHSPSRMPWWTPKVDDTADLTAVLHHKGFPPSETNADVGKVLCYQSSGETVFEWTDAAHWLYVKAIGSMSPGDMYTWWASGLSGPKHGTPHAVMGEEGSESPGASASPSMDEM